ncbi:MAG TPA: hypothetical protein VIP46_22965 [Pyrinomonadaceae bacterium]
MSDTKPSRNPDGRPTLRGLSLDQKVALAALLIFVALPSLFFSIPTLLVILMFLTGGTC